jgi:hypothetical protein
MEVETKPCRSPIRPECPTEGIKSRFLRWRAWNS